MAITIHIFYTGTNGNALKFAKEMTDKKIVDAIRAEEGNLRYEYFQPLEDPETILLIDSWEDQEAIDVHHASSMMQEIAALRDKYNLSMKVERCISDEEGIPQHDQQFIRT
jgi:quinol monooxygenase YgiN